MFDFKDNIGRHIALSGRHLAKLVAKELEPLGIGAGQYPYLFALYVEDGQSQQSLAKRLAVDKAAAARAVGKLVKSGYLNRAPDKSDTRSFRVSLTPKARNARKNLEEIVERVIQKLDVGLSDEERVQAKTILKKIAENLARLE